MAKQVFSTSLVTWHPWRHRLIASRQRRRWRSRWVRAAKQVAELNFSAARVVPIYEALYERLVAARDHPF